MSCDKYKEQLSLYILDDLTINEKSDIENHLDSCDACQKEVEEYRDLIIELTEVDVNRISEKESIHIKNSVYKSILQSAVHPKPSRNMLTYVIQTAAAIIIFLSGYFVSGYYSDSFQPANRYTINQNESELADSFKTYKNSKIGLKIIAKGKNAVNNQ